jgi:hypothetical protein
MSDGVSDGMSDGVSDAMSGAGAPDCDAEVEASPPPLPQPAASNPSASAAPTTVNLCIMCSFRTGSLGEEYVLVDVTVQKLTFELDDLLDPELILSARAILATGPSS